MDEFERGLNTAKEKFDGFTDKLAKAGETISNVGGALTKGIALPLAGLGTAIIKTGADYEAGMSKVQAISGAASDEIAMLGDEAMRMAEQTKFSTAEAAEAYQYMAMAGWDAQQMVDGLSGIMLLASASGESLASASDIVTDALTAFGLKAEDSGRFADVLAAASNSANTNVSMLGEAFKYVAPVAGAMGYSVEDVSAALGLMANSGIKASQAGTSLRSAITNMAAPTKNMAAVMDEYGISLTDADGEMLSLAEIMNVLRERMGGLDEAAQASAASALFGKEAMSGMLAVINAAPEDFDKLTEAINNSSGTTQEMADIMNDNAAGAMAMLSSAVNVLFTNLSQFLIPAFTSIVQKVTEAVQWFNSLDEGTQKLILTIGGIAAAAGPVLIAIGNIITAVSAIAGVLSGIGTAVTSIVSLASSGISAVIGVGSKLMGGIQALWALLLAHPVAAVVAAIIAAVVLLWTHCEEFRDFVMGMVEAVIGFFQDLAAGIAAALEGIADFIGSVFSKAWELVQAAWGAAVDFFSAVWSGIEAVFSAAAEVLGGFFSAAWELVQTAWEAAKEFFSGIAEGIRDVFETVTAFLGEAFTAAWDVVRGVWEAAAAFFGGIWNAVKDAAGTAAEFIGGALKGAWEAVKSAWDGAMDFFKGILDKITGVFSNIWDKFKDIGGNIVKGIKDGVMGAWDSFTSFISGKIQGIVDGVKGMLGIHSPSKVFAGIGENMALGLADGWDDQYKTVKSKIESGMRFGAAAAGVSASPAGYRAGSGGMDDIMPASRGGDTFNFYSPKALDPVSAAREMKKAKQQMAMGYVGG